MSEGSKDATGETPPSDNRRNFTRVFFDAEAVLIQGDRCWPAMLIDISLRGILIQNPGDIDLIESEPLEISIHLGGNLQIQMHLRFKHKEADQIGFYCDYMDLDSMTHLRRVVELNAADTSMLDRELSALG